MISIEKAIVEKSILNFSKEFRNQRGEIKSNLWETRKKYSKDLSKAELNFLSAIIKEFDKKSGNILIESDLTSVINNIGELPPVKFKQIRKNEVIYLKDLILMDLGYDSLRSNFYPIFFDQLGIKSCVYCNSQLAVSVTKNRYPVSKKGRKKPLYSLGNEIAAKYQLDHYHPKSKYPYLSASIFNLYPTCATCNNIKNQTEVDFVLYSDKVVPSKYKFFLEKIGKAEYLNTGDRRHLKVRFEDPDKKVENIKSPGSFEDTFHISSIYNTQIDLVEELFLKKKIYDDVYKSILKKSFTKIFNDVNVSNRILLGNYFNENEIHKRPMAKFMQDIARDIELIK